MGEQLFVGATLFGDTLTPSQTVGVAFVFVDLVVTCSASGPSAVGSRTKTKGVRLRPNRTAALGRAVRYRQIPMIVVIRSSLIVQSPA